MNACLISVVMPCYNEEKSILKSINSILNQTFSNFELIIIDDCSTDHSAEIIQSVQDNRIVYIKNIVNSGVAKSLNNGLKIAKGKFIARMDADDTCEPDRFEKQLKCFEANKNLVLCSSYADVYDGNKIKEQGVIITKNIKKYLVKGNPFVHSSIMLRNSLPKGVLRYPEIKGMEDYALWIKLSKYGDFYIIPEILIHRVDINNFGTKKTWENINQMIMYKKLFKNEIEAIKQTRYYGYGLLCCFNTLLKMFYIKFLDRRPG